MKNFHRKKGDVFPPKMDEETRVSGCLQESAKYSTKEKYGLRKEGSVDSRTYMVNETTRELEDSQEEVTRTQHEDVCEYEGEAGRHEGQTPPHAHQDGCYPSSAPNQDVRSAARERSRRRSGWECKVETARQLLRQTQGQHVTQPCHYWVPPHRTGGSQGCVGTLAFPAA